MCQDCAKTVCMGGHCRYHSMSPMKKELYMPNETKLVWLGGELLE